MTRVLPMRCIERPGAIFCGQLLVTGQRVLHHGSMRYRVSTQFGSFFHAPWQRAIRPWGLQAASRLRSREKPNVWQILQELDVDEETRGRFVEAQRAGSRFVLPEQLILSSPFLPGRVIINDEVGIDVEDDEDLTLLQEVFSGQWQTRAIDHPGHELAQDLISMGYLLPAEPRSRPHFDRPGIHRLQHASLLFRSESAAVVTDPVYFMGDKPCSWNQPGSLPAVDAVLLSHSHRNHFSLLSLMQFPRDVLIVLPPVSSPSILCEDMMGQLRSAGFTNIVAPPWYSNITVKDIGIHVYPFYGEQPWVGFAQPVPELRNWGSTYVVDCMDRKTWFLIDSGPEHGRTSTELCTRIAEDHGHIDFVMSNLREFHWFPGQIDGSGSFLFCFPLEELQRPERWPYDKLITYGPRGMREVLEALQPSYFFPYAHWFHELERASHYFEDTGRTENGLVKAILNDAPSRGQLRTQIMRWQVGDHLAWPGPGVQVSSPLLDG